MVRGMSTQRAATGHIYIDKRKRPEGREVWAAYQTEEDHLGTWVFTPKGSLYRSDIAGRLFYCNVGSPTGDGIAVLQLMPRNGWWIATFSDPGEARPTVSFDICTPPIFQIDRWTYTDLELDVVVDAASGAARTEDEDEFIQGCISGTITPSEADAARAANEEVLVLVSARNAAFVLAGTERFAEASKLGLLPVKSPND
jgi:hypothetical protein